MKRKIVIALMILLCFLLQSTVFQALAIGSISPNLMIILTASFGFMGGRKEGMIVGFFCGLLEDIFYGRLLGMHAIIYMYIGYGNGQFNRIFYGDDIKLPLSLISASELIYGLGTYMIMFVHEKPVRIFSLSDKYHSARTSVYSHCDPVYLSVDL